MTPLKSGYAHLHLNGDYILEFTFIALIEKINIIEFVARSALGVWLTTATFDSWLLRASAFAGPYPSSIAVVVDRSTSSDFVGLRLCSNQIWHTSNAPNGVDSSTSFASSTEISVRKVYMTYSS